MHEVPLLDADVERLANATGRVPNAFVDEDDGWRLLRGAGTGTGCVFFGTVQTERGDFRGCTVHAHRPTLCRTYPYVLADGPTGHPVLSRDRAVCPAASLFPAPPGILEHLVGVERQLEEERAARQASTT